MVIKCSQKVSFSGSFFPGGGGGGWGDSHMEGAGMLVGNF